MKQNLEVFEMGRQYLRSLPESEFLKILQLYESGKSLGEIARIYRMPKLSVKSALKKFSYEPRQLKKGRALNIIVSTLTPQAVENILNAGLSQSFVAKTLNVPPQLVRPFIPGKAFVSALNGYSVTDYDTDRKTKTDRDIAESFGLSPSSFMSWKRRNKVPRKKVNRYPKDIPMDDRSTELIQSHLPDAAMASRRTGVDESDVVDRMIRACLIASYTMMPDENAEKYIRATIRRTAIKSIVAKKKAIQYNEAYKPHN